MIVDKEQPEAAKWPNRTAIFRNGTPAVQPLGSCVSQTRKAAGRRLILIRGGLITDGPETNPAKCGRSERPRSARVIIIETNGGDGDKHNTQRRRVRSLSRNARSENRYPLQLTDERQLCCLSSFHEQNSSSSAELSCRTNLRGILLRDFFFAPEQDIK